MYASHLSLVGESLYHRWRTTFAMHLHQTARNNFEEIISAVQDLIVPIMRLHVTGLQDSATLRELIVAQVSSNLTDSKAARIPRLMASSKETGSNLDEKSCLSSTILLPETCAGDPGLLLGCWPEESIQRSDPKTPTWRTMVRSTCTNVGQPAVLEMGSRGKNSRVLDEPGSRNT